MAEKRDFETMVDEANEDDWNEAIEAHGDETVIKTQPLTQPIPVLTAAPQVPRAVPVIPSNFVKIDKEQALKRAKMFFASNVTATPIDPFALSLKPPGKSRPVIHNNKVQILVLSYTPENKVTRAPAKIEGQVTKWLSGEYIGHSPQKQEIELFKNVLRIEMPPRPPVGIEYYKAHIEVSGYQVGGAITVGCEVIISNLTYNLNWFEKETKKKVKENGALVEKTIPPTFEPKIQFSTSSDIVPVDSPTFSSKLSHASGNGIVECAANLFQFQTDSTDFNIAELPEECQYEHPLLHLRAPIPSAISNEWILRRRKDAGFVVLRIDNSLYTHADYMERIIETQYNDFDGWVGEMRLPEAPHGLVAEEKEKDKQPKTVAALNNSKMEGNEIKFQELPVIANPQFLGMVQEDGTPLPNGQLWIAARKRAVHMLGIGHVAIWQTCALQLLSGLKALAFVQLDAEKSKKLYERDVLDAQNFSFSYSGNAAFIYDYKNMFDVVGLNVSVEWLLQTKIEPLLTIKNWPKDCILRLDEDADVETSRVRCWNCMPIQKMQREMENAKNVLFYLVPGQGVLKTKNLDHSTRENTQALVSVLQFYKYNTLHTVEERNEHWDRLFRDAGVMDVGIFSVPVPV